MQNPIIFLDFDQTLNLRCDDPLRPTLVAHITAICKATGAEIVITSNQRLISSVANLSGQLFKAGLPRTVKILGITANHRRAEGDRSRWSEIERWLVEAGHNGNWVVIDDACGGAVPDENHIKVNYKTGITAADVARAIEILAAHP